MKKKYSLAIENIIAAIFILLFTYTAVSKISHIKGFTGAMKASPLLAAHSQGIAWLIIIAEIITVALLCFIPGRLLGLYASFALMTVFTFYIGYMLLTSSDLPCSCGGILREFSWKNHFILNMALTILSVVGIVYNLKNQKLRATNLF